MIFESYITFLQKLMLFSSYIKNNSSFPKPLTPKEEIMYLTRYQAGDQEAFKILIEHNLRLVAHIVKKYNGADEADDLISVGCLGLIKAIKSYKMNHGTQFSTYASKCIENEILMLLRVNKKHKNTMSVEEALGTDSEDNELAIIDIMFEDEDVESKVNNAVISEKLDETLKKVLSKREYAIICMRYGLNGMPALTQREVAQKLKISRSYISRLEKKALETMKENISKSEYY